jgi:hypothetical protein
MGLAVHPSGTLFWACRAENFCTSVARAAVQGEEHKTMVETNVALQQSKGVGTAITIKVQVWRRSKPS